jgi:hypothetical protein
LSQFRNPFAPARPADALADAVQVLQRAAGDPGLRMWLVEGLRALQEGRSRSLDAALGLRPLQPRQARARRAAALYRALAAALGVAGREAAREIRAMHRGDYLPQVCVPLIVELRRLRPSVPCERVILGALAARAMKSQSLLLCAARAEHSDFTTST